MKKTRKLIECALLIAIATVLSLIKLIDLPYGGSVTAASMLPMVIIAYRHGMGYGLLSGVVYGIIQQLTGLNTLSWVTGWQSIVAVIMLDYVVAFAVTGFGGIFKKLTKHSGVSLALGGLLVCVLRYVCHVISGCTVWAGLSIPDSAALIYSLGYNATYMIPETIVLVVAGYYLATTVDFDKALPVRKEAKKGGVWALLSGLSLSCCVIVDTVLLFSVLQDAETGDFIITNITQAPWTAIGIVSLVLSLLSAILFVIYKKKSY